MLDDGQGRRVMDTLLAMKLYERLSHVRALDLGSGPNPKDGYHGIDLGPGSDRVLSYHLAHGKPWPFADDSIERLHSSHFIEHIEMRDVMAHEFVSGCPFERSAAPTGMARSTRRQDALFWVMDEAYRVAQPGAEFVLRWPSLVQEATGHLNAIAFMDPTHRRFMPKETLYYFNRAMRERLSVSQYAIACDWEIGDVQQIDLGMGYEYKAWLRKPVPA